MADRHEIRVSDGDMEMAALKAVAAALAPLSFDESVRVLQWADARFGAKALSEWRDNSLRILTASLTAVDAAALARGITPEQMQVVAAKVIAEASGAVDERDDADTANA